MVQAHPCSNMDLPHGHVLYINNTRDHSTGVYVGIEERSNGNTLTWDRQGNKNSSRTNAGATNIITGSPSTQNRGAKERRKQSYQTEKLIAYTKVFVCSVYPGPDKKQTHNVNLKKKKHEYKPHINLVNIGDIGHARVPHWIRIKARSSINNANEI